MNHRHEVQTEEATEPDSYQVLSHEIRVKTLEVLADDGLKTFKQLQEAVGVSDPGRFNYHLNKLKEDFVTGSEEGYRLTGAGWNIVGAVLASGYSERFIETEAETGLAAVTVTAT